MKVYNAAQKPIVVRAFAAKKMSDPKHLVLIPQGESHSVYGPDMSEFGLPGQYLLFGDLLVRDWGPLQITPNEEMKRVSLVKGQYETFKQPFRLNPALYEGVFVSYYDESYLVGI